MNQPIETLTVAVNANISPFKSALQDLEKQSSRFGASFASAVKGAIVHGKSFEDTLRSIALRLTSTALTAGLRPLQNLASGLFGSLFSSLGGLVPNAQGSVVNSGGIVPFADGGIVSTPTFFQAGHSMGLMGEAGAEAILPLTRSSDGRLGVRAQGAQGSTNVVFNVTTPDAQSFHRSEGQISAMLTRVVSRGRRNL